MSDATLWWLAAGALIAVELVSGTFYLLMIATGLVAAALAAHAGLGSVTQWVLAATVGTLLVLVWRRYKRLRPTQASATVNANVNMDIGEVVHVDAFNADGSCSVKYRGAHWDAQLQSGEAATPGAYTIAEVVGSRLMLKKTTSL